MKKLNYIFLLLTCLVLLGACGNKVETVTVHTAEEFIKALKPDTHIIIDADDYLDINGAARNSNLPVFDRDNPTKGVYKQGGDDETFIISLDNIVIEGSPEKGRAHFLGHNEMLDVLVFWNCKNVTIKHIRAGHAQSGECSGDVFWIKGCDYVTIDDCELYGCGVVGANINNSKNVSITNSWIYECSDAGIDISESENATVSNTLIDHCYWAFRIVESCKNVAFTKCTINNNDQGGLLESPVTFTDCGMQPLEDSHNNATINNCKELTPTEGYRDLMDGRALAAQEDYDPEEDGEEYEQGVEYITDCYTGEVEYSEPEGAQIKGSELETVTVHNVDEFKNAIGSNKKIVIESSEKLSCSDEIEFIGLINMVIDGKNAVTDFKFMFTSGCSDIIIQDITLESIHIGAGCNGFDILRCKTPDEGGADYCLRIFDAENIFVNSCEIWYSPTIINKSTDIEFVGCNFNQCNRYMEANDISNVWFNACTFENSPGDGESDEYGHFKLDSPVVFLKCRLKVWQAYADFSMAKLIECPKCFADMEDWSDLYE